jgi:nucleoside-diphosphate-sugar epimerase
MVIGKGLIASSFEKYSLNDEVIIFASGVSNSLEMGESEYQREFDLLKSKIARNRLFIYFSTCSLFDKSQSNSRYVIHKREIERFIRETGMPHIIFRLPIVVSNSTNKNTLTNFLYNHIKHDIPFTIHSKACRYLIDISDIISLLSPIIENTEAINSTINVSLDNQIKVSELVCIFEKILDKKAIVKYVNRGDCYKIEDRFFLRHLKLINYNTEPKYNSLVLNKYYGSS